jgi:hypothetical protein
MILIRDAEQDCSFVAQERSLQDSASSRSERLAALQAKSSMAGRNQAAKWAHPLGREIAIAWGDPQLLSQRRSHIGAQAANTAKKRLREGSHEIPHIQNRCPSGAVRHGNHYRSPSAILCKIARFWMRSLSRESTYVSNSDQLLQCHWAIIGTGDEHSFCLLSGSLS